MNKTVLLLASAAIVSLGAPSFAAEKESYKSETKMEKDAKGNYEAKTTIQHTDTDGTTTNTEKMVDVDANSDGTTEKTVKTEKVVDPKGLMNKSKVKTEDTTKTNADGILEKSHKKVVDGKTVEESVVKH